MSQWHRGKTEIRGPISSKKHTAYAWRADRSVKTEKSEDKVVGRPTEWSEKRFWDVIRLGNDKRADVGRSKPKDGWEGERSTMKERSTDGRDAGGGFN